jgi:serine/threonine-protein kinase
MYRFTSFDLNQYLNRQMNSTGIVYSECSDPTKKVTVTTLAGSGNSGATDGIGAAASFYMPNSIAIDRAGNAYVADKGNNKIRKITSAGVVTTFAGSGSVGFADGTGVAASFFYPTGIVIDNSGDFFVADGVYGTIRKITSAGVVTTFVGSVASSNSYPSTDGTDTTASFYGLNALAIDNSSGNLFGSELSKIRKITSAGVVTTLAGTNSNGSVDGIGTSASFYYPRSVAVDNSGNVYVADYGNYKVRKISPDGVVTSFAGTGSYGSKDGIGTAASFNYPSGLVVDSSGNVYVSDFLNNRIRKITSSGVVTTLAGRGELGLDDGLGSEARFGYPEGLAIDNAGIIYVADSNRIRKISCQ